MNDDGWLVIDDIWLVTIDRWRMIYARWQLICDKHMSNSRWWWTPCILLPLKNKRKRGLLPLFLIINNVYVIKFTKWSPWWTWQPEPKQRMIFYYEAKSCLPHKLKSTTHALSFHSNRQQQIQDRSL